MGKMKRQYLLIEIEEQRETRQDKSGNLKVAGFPRLVSVIDISWGSILKLIKAAITGKFNIKQPKQERKENFKKMPNTFVIMVSPTASGIQLLNKVNLQEGDTIVLKKD